MYTVLYITGDPALVEGAAGAINAVAPGTLEPRARNAGYAAALSREDSWEAHVDAMCAFFELYGPIVRAASGEAVHVVCDTMIECEDLRSDLPWTTFGYPPRLVHQLGVAGAAVAFSVYVTEPMDE